MQFSHATIWLLTALLLAGLEMFTGTFFLLAIASGMLVGAVMAWFGTPVPVQMLVAALAGISSVVVLHHWRKRRLPPPEVNAAMEIGQQVRVVEWKGVTLARVQYRGTQWDGELAAGARHGQENYFIVAVRGTVLILHHNPPPRGES
ncbi:NfeD family protein [Formivibrio citricus]|uniref:NfeD family protein n=1 Tax=Formivibrio citricus TaxID=83765 RepID=UPI000B87FBC4|nr:hypothetical protein [Formivibrio citricus]